MVTVEKRSLLKVSALVLGLSVFIFIAYQPCHIKYSLLSEIRYGDVRHMIFDVLLLNLLLEVGKGTFRWAWKGNCMYVTAEGNLSFNCSTKPFVH